ncbi:MAG: M23 family metallopeptidase [Myxococcota bacterium]
MVLAVLTAQVIVPAAVCAWICFPRSRHLLPWWLTVLLAFSTTMFFYVAGRWDILGYPLRYALPVGFLAAATTSWIRRETAPSVPRSALVVQVVCYALMALPLLWLLVNALLERRAPGNAVELSFPLREGRFYVSHGGSGPLLNQHHDVHAQRYALDINQLNAWGRSINALTDGEPRDYPIFGRPVHSPCRGTVVTTENDLPDLTPPDRDPQRPAGNHVVVECLGVKVLMAHLRQGSVRVRPGDDVGEGDVLAEVGNSGNTSRPHLHLEAVRNAQQPDLDDGDPAPMTFGGEALVRNDVRK